MSETAVTFRWAEGFEFADQRSRVRSLAHDAIAIAEEGLQQIQIEPLRSVYLVMHAVGPRDQTWAAEATGPKTMHLYLKAAQLARHRLSAPTLADTVFHEQIHCLRKEAIPKSANLPEMAATEGLAYVAEYGFRDWRFQRYGGVMPRDDSSLLNKVKALPVTEKRAMRRGLIDVSFSAGAEADSWQYWHHQDYRRFRIGRDVVVGIESVLRHRREGRSIASLLRQSTAEVIGVA